MDIRQLKLFLAVCEYGSILSASQHLYISQQALSKTISTLERELGEDLFVRTPKGITTTEIGELLKEQSAPIVAQFDDMLSLISQRVIGKKDNISIGIANGLWVFFAPLLRMQLSGKYNDLNIDLQEHSFDVVEEMTAKGALSLSIVNGPCNNPNLIVEKIADVKRYALVSKNSPMAEKKVISFDDLKGQKLVMNMNSRCKEKFFQICKKKKLEFDIKDVSDTIAMLVLITSEQRVGIYPAHLLLSLPLEKADLTAIPFMKNEMSYELDLVLNPSNHYSKATVELAEIIKEMVRNICEPLE